MSSNSECRSEQTPLRLGVIGLGRGFMLTLPSLLADERVKLIAACAPRASSRAAFEKEFGGRTYDRAEDICADPDVEAVYIATPHQMHVDHVSIAARAGKHVLVEKPLAISLEDGIKMVEACEQAGVQLIVGPSHSFDGAVSLAHDIIQSGKVGRVRMIQALNYTDFLYRPRRPEELVTAEGGGVIFSQAVHQLDIVRLLGGGMVKTITAATGNWDPERSTEGAYSALVCFEGGAFASLTYSGYAHFDSDVWQDWVGELGYPKDPANYGQARIALSKVSSPQEEVALKSGRTYGETPVRPPAPHHEHFGPIVVSCEGGDLRITADGVWLHGDFEQKFIPAPMHAGPRSEVVSALISAVHLNAPPSQTGRWGLATLEACHAILQSAETAGTVKLVHQIPSKETNTGGNS